MLAQRQPRVAVVLAMTLCPSVICRSCDLRFLLLGDRFHLALGSAANSGSGSSRKALIAQRRHGAEVSETAGRHRPRRAASEMLGRDARTPPHVVDALEGLFMRAATMRAASATASPLHHPHSQTDCVAVAMPTLERAVPARSVDAHRPDLARHGCGRRRRSARDRVETHGLAVHQSAQNASG
jgi:hypothetical protein